MSKKIRQSVKIKGHYRSISLFPPQSDKRKARKLRRKMGKEMAVRLQNMPYPQPLYINLEEEIERGNIDVGYLTWDGPPVQMPDWVKDLVKDLKNPGMDTGYGWFRMKHPDKLDSPPSNFNMD